jgi:hypothetical protein
MNPSWEGVTFTVVWGSFYLSPDKWRTRVDPFELAWPLVRRWLEAEPDRTAKELFQRIQTGQPGIFVAGQAG